jgi:superfamily II DNA/RNA helicase
MRLTTAATFPKVVRGPLAHDVVVRACADMGFQKAVDSILGALDRTSDADSTANGGGGAKKRRQSILLSATLSNGLRALAGRSLTNYGTLQISKTGAELSAPPTADDSGTWAAASTAVATHVASAAKDDGDDEGVAPPTTTDGVGGELGMDEKMDAPSGLNQSYVLVPTRHRLTALFGLLRSRLLGGGCKMIVFVSSCDEVDFLYEVRWIDLT